MSFAFLPIYTGDYIRDTRHLTPLKHGVYFLLLMHCWDQKGPLPLDEQECAGIANCRSADEVESLRYILARFFVRMEDGFYNHRMQAEIERAEAISRARSDAGKKGYEAKAKQLPSKSQASASTPTTTTTTTPTPTTTENPSVRLAPHDPRREVERAEKAARREAAVRVLAFLNEKANRAFDPVDKTLAPIEARLKEGYTEGQCRQVIVRKVDQWTNDPKMVRYLRPKTLFGEENFANYKGELVIAKETSNA